MEVRELKVEGFSDEKWNPIVEGVDLAPRRGQVLGLIGESGAGKSTFGNRFPHQISGGQLQLVMTAMSPRQTVGEVIGRLLEFYNSIKGRTLEQRVIVLLEQIDLNERFNDRVPSELSGGQLQRCAYWPRIPI